MTKFHKDGTLPLNGEIFVFGSNLAGIHGAGAAKIAHQKFGAVYGSGMGLMGKSWAIPTKDNFLNTLTLSDIARHIHIFVNDAPKFFPEHKWFVVLLDIQMIRSHLFSRVLEIVRLQKLGDLTWKMLRFLL